jgi:hypothetical protein
LRCYGTEFWRGQILDRRFKNIDVQIDIRRIAGYKNKEQNPKIGIHVYTI